MHCYRGVIPCSVAEISRALQLMLQLDKHLAAPEMAALMHLDHSARGMVSDHTSMLLCALASWTGQLLVCSALAVLELFLGGALAFPFFLGFASGPSSSSAESRTSSPSWPASNSARFSSSANASRGTSVQCSAICQRSRALLRQSSAALHPG